jgi:hypothetical protein
MPYSKPEKLRFEDQIETFPLYFGVDLYWQAMLNFEKPMPLRTKVIFPAGLFLELWRKKKG